MAVNRHRGEVEAIIDGRTMRLCLTLGALAELEDAFAADSLATLAERFGTGRLSARDLTRVIGAGLRGGGHSIDDDTLAGLAVAGGATGAARIASALLQAAFGAEEPTANP